MHADTHVQTHTGAHACRPTHPEQHLRFRGVWAHGASGATGAARGDRAASKERVTFTCVVRSS